MSAPTPIPDDKIVTRSDARVSEAEVTTEVQSDTEKAKPVPIWLQRVSLLVQVMFCVYLGLLLVILPWWPHLLENNDMVNAYPWLHDVLSLGAVRGILSGIGLLDIWIGISEVIHYEEIR